MADEIARLQRFLMTGSRRYIIELGGGDLREAGPYLQQAAALDYALALARADTPQPPERIKHALHDPLLAAVDLLETRVLVDPAHVRDFVTNLDGRETLAALRTLAAAIPDHPDLAFRTIVAADRLHN